MKLHRNYLTVIISIFLFTEASAQQQVTEKKETDSLEARMVLIGDAGSLVEGRPSVLNSIKKYFPFDNKTTVVFLGDNLYDYGLPDETYQRYNSIKAALDSQINLVRGTAARAIMIPGNHDWANGKAEGWENVVRQQQYVDQFSSYNFEFLPKGGCPGPVEVKISKDVVMIVMDSQWWLHLEDKPGVESDCPFKTEEEVINELKEIMNKNFDKLVILALHHPFKSNGPHGGYYTLKQHIFPFTDINKNLYIPLPVIGSVYPITRSVFGSKQDIKHPAYQNLINKVMPAIKNFPNVVFVSGHEHNLEYIKDSSYNYIISGAGCKTNRVSPGRKAPFAKEALGFATLDIYKSKKVQLSFYTVDETRKDSLFQDYNANILDFSKLPPVEKQDTVTAEYVYKDYVIAPASSQYKKVNGLKKLVNGSNYRKEWSEPVQLKVFNINKEKGGFKIEGLGGGNQTKSLKLKDKKGDEWSLRTIDKDPDKAIPENFRNSFASAIIQDMISAAHPYAPSVTHYLAEAADIIEPARDFFYVPDDPSLGYYRPFFANKVCMLERKDPNRKEDNKSTFKIIDKIREENDHTIDQNKVLNARLLDMLIGDWDRHFDQWRWATDDTGRGKTYYPMPKDRDQAFFKSNGLLITFVRRFMPFLKGFTGKMDELGDLNMVAKDFDRLFLNGIDKHTWDSVTVAFTEKMTDEKIRYAVKQFPPEIYALRGKKIEDKLIKRRDQLRERSLQYYLILANTVAITASNQDEKVQVVNDPSGNVVVTIFSYDRIKKDSSFITYHRVFNPRETKEVRVYGFNGQDKFLVDSTLSTRMKFRFIGGKGNDTFLVRSGVRVYAYDVTTEQNLLQGGTHTKNEFSANYGANRYELRGYKYNQSSFPKLNIGYNVDDGLLLGGGAYFKRYKFRREPFANEHRLTTLFALTRKGFQAKYNGVFNEAIHNNDVLVNLKLNNPGINNFYGIGNETKAVFGKRFYMVRYKTFEGEVLFNIPKYTRKLNLYAGPTFFHYWNRYENNSKLVLKDPEAIGLDSADVYSKHTYAGIKAGFDLINLNNTMIPTSGIIWKNTFNWQKGISSGTGNSVAKFETDMTVYASTKIPARVTGVIKLGYGKIFTDSTKYFQALTLGQNNNLRGFRKNRFAGDELAYGSLELRIKLFNSKSYLLPGPVGLILFDDAGRVWQKGERSTKWHNSYGGGLYFTPFNAVIVSATVGRSEDGNVFNISLGTKFNLTL